jgi:nicotinamide-nucleotide amidase
VADDAGCWSPRSATRSSRADVVIATGGLGPTEDDLTREAAAAALGRPLHRDPALIEELKARFARVRARDGAVNEKQADVIEGAVVLRNPRGTRPGQRVEAAGACSCSSPAAARDAPMFEEQVCPSSRERAGGARLRTRILKIAAMGRATSSRSWPPSTRPSRTRAPRSWAGRDRSSCT